MSDKPLPAVPYLKIPENGDPTWKPINAANAVLRFSVSATSALSVVLGIKCPQ